MHDSQLIKKNLQIQPSLLPGSMVGLTHSVLHTLLLDFGGVGLLSPELQAAHDCRLKIRLFPFLVRTGQESPLSCQLLLTEVEVVLPVS